MFVISCILCFTFTLFWWRNLVNFMPITLGCMIFLYLEALISEAIFLLIEILVSLSWYANFLRYKLRSFIFIDSCFLSHFLMKIHAWTFVASYTTNYNPPIWSSFPFASTLLFGVHLPFLWRGISWLRFSFCPILFP